MKLLNIVNLYVIYNIFKIINIIKIMGSTPIISSILPTEKKKKRFPNTFKGNYERYKYLHEQLGQVIAIHAQNTLDDINHSQINEIGTKIRNSYRSYKKQIDKLDLGLNQNDYERVMFDLCTEKILKDFMIIEN